MNHCNTLYLIFKMLLEVTIEKNLIRFLPFWRNEDIGIISKICLTFTMVIMGLFSGSICLVYGFMVLSSNSPFIQEDVFRGLLYLISGGTYISWLLFIGYIMANNLLKIIRK